MTSRKRKQEHRAALERAEAKGQIRTVTLAELQAEQEGNDNPDTNEAAMKQTTFAQVPVESDTTIHNRQHLTLESLDVQWERWSWDGIAGETAVFIEDQLGSTDDKALEDLVRSSERLAPSGPVTVTRGRNGYAFVNFNFRT